MVRYDSVVTRKMTLGYLAIYPMPTWSERIENPAWYKTTAEIAIVSIAGFGVAFCLFLMILFYVWRDKPQIVAASLIFVELIMLGALMMFASSK